MGEARAPVYLDGGGARVSLFGAESSYVTGALAAERRTDSAGRPGINPLRYDVEFTPDSERLAQLQMIDEALGTRKVTEKKRNFGIRPDKNPDAYNLQGHFFVSGDEPGVHTSPNERDMEAICRWIQDARRQADLVAVSLHAHEGPNCDSNNDEPAEFVIDAGADVFIGQGSSRPAGYRDLPRETDALLVAQFHVRDC